MAQVSLLGEQVNTRRTVDERTAFAIGEILDERDYQDNKWSQELGGVAPDASHAEKAAAALEVDKRWSGSDWNGFIDKYQSNAKPDMNDPETRKAFVKVAALALAALRAS